MNSIANLTRPENAPKILETGHSSLGAPDRMAKMLGWFSLGLGATQLLFPRAVTRHLGIGGWEGWVRACGAREIGAGVLSLSIDKKAGLVARLIGDGIDVAALVAAHHPLNPRQSAVSRSLLLVAGIAVLDAIALQSVRTRHSREGRPRSYRDRSGFPQGVQAVRQLSRDGLAKRKRDESVHVH